MKKLLAKSILLLLIVALLLAGVFVLCLALPPIFSESYNAAVFDKYDRLMSIDGPKIVLVGGSNLAFGLDSEAIESALGMPVVNFGLHAGMGLGPTLDITRAGIGQGDIIVLALEYEILRDPEPSYAVLVSTLENDLGLYRYVVHPDNCLKIASQFLQYSVKNIADKLRGRRHGYEGVYRRDVFNHYGDVIIDRPELVAEQIAEGYLLVEPALISGEAVDILRGYRAYAAERGASVYLSFPSLNELCIAEGSALEAYQAALSETTGIPLISDIRDSIYPCASFFDNMGKYHLNDGAVPLRTAQMIEDIQRAGILPAG